MHLRQALCLRPLGVAVILILALAAACTSPATPAPDDVEHMEASGTSGMDMGDADAEEPDVQIPNDGAVVRIVSPADGETITGNEVEVKIETEGFTLGEEGRHWHVYLDGSEAAMVTGTDTSQVLRGLTPGEHEIRVTLANGEHQELEDGATIHITILG